MSVSRFVRWLWSFEPTRALLFLVAMAVAFIVASLIFNGDVRWT